MHVRPLLLAPLLIPCAGCFLFGGTPRAPAAPPSLGDLHRLSDVDRIQDVAIGSEHLWVATNRGVVRHLLTGGEPTRLSTVQGLPSDDIIAIAADGAAAWAATPAGLAKLSPTEVERLDDTPDVGIPTSLAIGPDHAIWIGGTRGVGRGDGTSWQRYSDRYSITSLAADASGLWIGTTDSGAVRLAGGVFFEHTISIGLPSNFVRSIISLGSGGALALCQAPTGSSIAFFDGQKWFGYTIGVDEPLLGLVSVNGQPFVYTGSAFYRLDRTADGPGTPLVPVGGGGEGAARQFRARPETAQPAAAAPLPAPAATPQAAPSAQPAATTVAPGPAATPGSPRRGATRGAPSVPAQGPAAPTDPLLSPISAPQPAPEPEQAARSPLPAAVRPVIAPEEEFEAPRWMALAESTSAGAPIVLARSRDAALYVATAGLGVSRFEGGRHTPYRTHDLMVTNRAFSVGTDPGGTSWILTKTLEAARFDGEAVERVQIDPDPSIKILAFATGPGAAFAVGHAEGTDWWRLYRNEGGRWRMVVERQLMAETGVVDVSFLAVDSGGRFWMGLKARTARGTIVERGVAVVDANAPTVAYHHSRANPETDGQGAMRIPDSISAIAFGRGGEIWLAGLEGAVRIRGSEVVRYGASQGLEGELVGDLDMGPGGVPYVATPEGIGHFDGDRWKFERNSVVTQAHPIAVAVDGDGNIWGGGGHGALLGDGRTWRRIGSADGLLSDDVSDIRVDGNNRIWFVTSEGLTVLSRRPQPPEQPSP